MKGLEKEIMGPTLHQVLSEIFEMEKRDFMNYLRENREKKYIIIPLLLEENLRYKPMLEPKSFC